MLHRTRASNFVKEKDVFFVEQPSHYLHSTCATLVGRTRRGAIKYKAPPVHGCQPAFSRWLLPFRLTLGDAASIKSLACRYSKSIVSSSVCSCAFSDRSFSFAAAICRSPSASFTFRAAASHSAESSVLNASRTAGSSTAELVAVFKSRRVALVPNASARSLQVSHSVSHLATGTALPSSRLLGLSLTNRRRRHLRSRSSCSKSNTAGSLRIPHHRSAPTGRAFHNVGIR